MARILIESTLLLILIVANGLFAMSEIAVVSARKVRLEQRARRGDRRARIALELQERPNRFLSTVQIGITLIGILAGAFGGASLARELGPRLNDFPIISPRGEEIAFALVVIVITYLSLVVGELVPKRIALSNPERVAALMAPPLRTLSKVARPAVWVLAHSSDALIKLLRIPQREQPAMTEEELTSIVSTGARTGLFHPVEAEMVRRVFALGDRNAAVLMTPRPDIVWLDANSTLDELMPVVRSTQFSRYPVAEGSLDKLLGVLDLRSLAVRLPEEGPFQIRDLLRPPLIVPENAPAFTVLKQLQAEHQELAFVIDEYGGVEGIVTLSDLATSVMGEEGEDSIVVRDDGSLLVPGTAKFEDLRKRLGIMEAEDLARYDTVAGFVLSTLQRIPRAGVHFEAFGHRFEVVDMDRNRIDMLLVERLR